MSAFYDVTISVEVVDAERLRLAAAKHADESGAHYWESTGPEDDLRMLLDQTTVDDSGFQIAESTAVLTGYSDEPNIELVAIKRDVTAEGVTIPAGTVCVVEQRHAITLDLFDTNSGTLFWLPIEDVEPAAA